MNLILSDRPLDLPGLFVPDLEYIDLSSLNIKHCIGCFGCWTKTPGRCVIRDDAVKVYPAIAASTRLLYVSRVRYGGYDTTMKTMLERSIPVQQAFLRLHHGETHHVQRAVATKDAVILGYDVPEDAWYARAVNTLASMGVVAGVGGEKFWPEAPITRAEFVAMAGRFAHPVEAGGMTFADVQEDDWFYEEVQSAIWYGWISGYPDGTFGPEQPMTRAQAAAILNRMLGRSADRAFLAEDHGLREFRDVSKSHGAYFDICEAANGHGYEKRDGLEFWNAILS
ncbi:S-layer homology domain-containing protein [Pseudoflavonifractor sp. MCC625]|uniref:S-layer homology domain-containing protein n=1 Tax=Pseudoflavonifractor sp. MCC625 TaxID=2592647 RepID=UPI001C02BC6A|nr:S-layer homology domain-containing protein [Pseudoflavonifractor sp. MCC625]MBT9683731.1 hypothetical protein [Pseudoflavonifractor sp. MCC625]